MEVRWPRWRMFSSWCSTCANRRRRSAFSASSSKIRCSREATRAWMAAWASGGIVFQSGVGIDGGRTIPSTTKVLSRGFGLGMTPAARKPRSARDELLNSYPRFCIRVESRRRLGEGSSGGNPAHRRMGRIDGRPANRNSLLPQSSTGNLVAVDQPLRDGRDPVGLGELGSSNVVGCEPVVDLGGLGLVRGIGSGGGMEGRGLVKAVGGTDACRRSRKGADGSWALCEVPRRGELVPCVPEGVIVQKLIWTLANEKVSDSPG